jgi:hypothetical protein
MTVRKCLISAALAVLSCGSAVFAADQSSAGSGALTSDNSAQPVYMDASGPTSLTPTMYLLDPTGFGKWLEQNKISFQGYVEGGYWYDTSNPRFGGPPATGGTGDYPTDVGFPGNFSNRPQLDQLDASLTKTIDTTKSWDWGFDVEGGYGTDDALIHSNGLSVVGPGHVGALATRYVPRNQLDLVQANFSVLVPLGTGLTIKGGKFVTPIGYEYIDPILNPFYSHSYLFTFGIPLTQTGLTFSYDFSKLVNGNDLTVLAGFTRGWNQSTNDNNGDPDFLGEITTAFDKAGNFGFTFNFSEGPQTAGDDKDFWTVMEAIPTYKVSDELTLALDTLYGDAPHQSAITPGASAQWYSIAAYAAYKFNPYATANVRVEWYRDQGAMTVNGAISAANATPIPPVLSYSTNYYEATAGVTIHPLPNDNIFQYLELRPEVREDWADRPAFNASHTSAITHIGDYTQFSVAMDAIMQF